MPVYNGTKFIREALDSLLAQTFTDFELIISDNASTDETEIICQEYADKDSRIRYVRQVENLGAVANFNYVKFKAKEYNACYFAWMASDDLWPKNYLDILVKAHEMKPSAVLCFGGVDLYDADTKYLGESRNNYFTTPLFNVNCEVFIHINSLKYYLDKNPYKIYGLFKYNAIREIDLEEVCGTPQHSDNLFLMKVFVIGCGYYANRTSLKYRVIPKTASEYAEDISFESPSRMKFETTIWFQFMKFIIKKRKVSLLFYIFITPVVFLIMLFKPLLIRIFK